MSDVIVPPEGIPDPSIIEAETLETDARPKTMSRREMLREQRRNERLGYRLEVLDYERPKCRGDCRNGPRPCLFVACKHHLFLDVNPETGSIKLNFPGQSVLQMRETCALDVAERGGVTLEEVGEIVNLTRERVRQVEMVGLVKLREAGFDMNLESFLDIEIDPSQDPGKEQVQMSEDDV